MLTEVNSSRLSIFIEKDDFDKSRQSYNRLLKIIVILTRAELSLPEGGLSFSDSVKQRCKKKVRKPIIRIAYVVRNCVILYGKKDVDG